MGADEVNDMTAFMNICFRAITVDHDGSEHSCTPLFRERYVWALLTAYSCRKEV